MTMHPRLAEAFERIDAAVFSGDSFEDPDNRANMVDYLNRWSREIATSGVSNDFITSDANAPTPDQQRPIEEQRLLQRAFDDAKVIIDDDTGAVTEREDRLAQAYLILVGDLAAAFAAWRKYNPDRPSKCGWCIHAHGNTQEAWDGLPWFESNTAIREHTLSCGNNPAVVALRDAITDIQNHCQEYSHETDRTKLAEWIAMVMPREPVATRPSQGDAP